MLYKILCFVMVSINRFLVILVHLRFLELLFCHISNFKEFTERPHTASSLWCHSPLVSYFARGVVIKYIFCTLNLLKVLLCAIYNYLIVATFYCVLRLSVPRRLELLENMVSAHFT